MLLPSNNGFLRGAAILVMMVLLLAHSVTVLDQVDAEPSDSYQDIEENRSDRAYETAIDISGNSEFSQKVQDEGWSGNGSEENPYMIQDVVFDGTGYSIGLRISDVDYYFVIRNCTFYSADVPSSYDWKTVMVWLNYVNCRMENNAFLCNESRYVVRIFKSNIEFEGNEVWAETYGIFGEWGELRVTNTTFHGSYSHVIEYLYGKAEINDDRFIGRNGQGTGILLDGTSISRVLDNEFGNYYSCIVTRNDRLRPCTSLDIIGNSCLNVYTGLDISGANNSLIENNSVVGVIDTDYVRPGIEITASENLTISTNDLVGCPFSIGGFTRYPDGSGNWRNISLDSTNTVDSTPVQFHKDAIGLDVAEGYSQTIIVNCSQVSLREWTGPIPPYGIIIEQSDHIEIVDNSIGDRDEGKVAIIGSDDIEISRNKCNGQVWFDLRDVQRINISENELPAKLSISNGRVVKISNNSFVHTDTDGGIVISGGRDVTVAHNLLSYPMDINISGGISIDYVTDTRVIGNEIRNGNGFAFYNGNRAFFETLEFDDNNTVDGKKVLCLANVGEQVVSGEYHQVIRAHHQPDPGHALLRYYDIQSGIHRDQDHHSPRRFFHRCDGRQLHSGPRGRNLLVQGNKELDDQGESDTGCAFGQMGLL
jgi:hypothetical protein